MKTIGLTGNIGSGKSTVAKVFAAFGFEILDADALAKSLYHQDEIRIQVETLLGETIVDSEGKIDYACIARHYFSHREKYDALNNILYPALQKLVKAEMEARGDKPVLVEAAMLFEAGLENEFDCVVAVSAPVNLRMSRVQERNGLSPEQFMERENRQMSAQEKETRANFVILNDESRSVIEQVQKVVEQL